MLVQQLEKLAAIKEPCKIYTAASCFVMHLKNGSIIKLDFTKLANTSIKGISKQRKERKELLRELLQTLIDLIKQR